MKIRRITQDVKRKWMNKQTAECLRSKSETHNRFKYLRNCDERTTLVELIRKAKRLIKQIKRSTGVHFANQSNTSQRECYSFIRQKRLIASTTGTTIDGNGDFTNDEEHICCILKSSLQYYRR